MDYPLILHILSYDHDQIHRLVSKSLSQYANGQQSYYNRRLDISLLIKMNIFHEYAVVLLSDYFIASVCEQSAQHGNLSALQWARNPNCQGASMVITT